MISKEFIQLRDTRQEKITQAWKVFEEEITPARIVFIYKTAHAERAFREAIGPAIVRRTEKIDLAWQEYEETLAILKAEE